MKGGERYPDSETLSPNGGEGRVRGTVAAQARCFLKKAAIGSNEALVERAALST
jgi:hypothetical protein